jgi:protein-tyrosine-phosphatase
MPLYILFLCQHGILRSAYAKAVAKKYASRYNQDWIIEFGGLYDETTIGPGRIGTFLTRVVNNRFVRDSFVYTLICIDKNQLDSAYRIYVMTDDMQSTLLSKRPDLSSKVVSLGLPENLLTSFFLTKKSKKEIEQKVNKSLESLLTC